VKGYFKELEVIKEQYLANKIELYEAIRQVHSIDFKVFGLVESKKIVDSWTKVNINNSQQSQASFEEIKKQLIYELLNVFKYSKMPISDCEAIACKLLEKFKIDKK
jgi:hypothetical protein